VSQNLNRSPVGIAADDSPLHHQFQRATVIQQERPEHQQFDLATSGERVFGLKKDTAAADVESSTRAELRDWTSVPQLILNVQRDCIPPV